MPEKGACISAHWFGKKRRQCQHLAVKREHGRSCGARHAYRGIFSYLHRLDDVVNTLFEPLDTVARTGLPMIGPYQIKFVED